MLRVADLHAGYGRAEVLFGVSLEVNAGTVSTLLGRNGMGKTTTIKTLFGILPTKRGEARFNDTVISGLPPHRIARLGLALVPEGRQIFPNLTVRENLTTTAANFGGSASPRKLEDIFRIFPHLAERSRNMGDQLSGGEQQMLAIGRALMTNPTLLVLDEATEGLAPLVREEIWRVIGDLKREGLSILVIDKDIETLTRIGDRHYVIDKGKIVWVADSAQLTANTELRRRFLSV